MLKIFPLDYYRLSNTEHYALMDFMKQSFDVFPIVPESFPEAVELFIAAVENEHHATQHIFRHQQSAEIQAADAERIKCFRLVRDYAKLKLRANDKAVVQAAETIVNLSNAFGGSSINSQSVDSRSGNLQVFIQRLEEDYHDEVATLKLQPCIEELQEANHHYSEALMERDFSDAELGKNAIKRARKRSDFTLKTLLSQVQGRINLGKGADLEAYVKFINVEIDHYRIILGQGPGGRPPKRRKKEEAEVTEEVVEL